MTREKETEYLKANYSGRYKEGQDFFKSGTPRYPDYVFSLPYEERAAWHLGDMELRAQAAEAAPRKTKKAI